MSRLGRFIAEAVVLHYGRDELLRRLASPFWFQSFGAVMGMDWQGSPPSAGSTSSRAGSSARRARWVDRRPDAPVPNPAGYRKYCLRIAFFGRHRS